MQTLVRLVSHLQHALETMLEILIIITPLFIPIVFLFTWLRKYQATTTTTQPLDTTATTTTTTQSHDPSTTQTLHLVLDALTIIQRVLDHIFSALEQLLCRFIWFLNLARLGLRTARMKTETVRGCEGGSVMDLQRVGLAIVDLVATVSLVLIGGVVVFSPLLLGCLVGYWARGGCCGEADVLGGLNLALGEVGGLGMENLVCE